MFEHFTFGAVAQVQQQQDEVLASPTDCRFPSSIPSPTSYIDDECSSPQPRGMEDIVQGFALQSIRPNENEFPRRSLWDTLPSPDFSVDDTTEDSTEEDLSYHSTIRGMVTISSTRSMPNLLANAAPSVVANHRLRRQLNVQLQSCNKHIRDIGALVGEMIESNSQCNLHVTTPRPCLAPPSTGVEEVERLALDTDVNSSDDEQARDAGLHEDEGFAEMNGDEALNSHFSLRRSSAPSGIRKYNLAQWRSSADCVTRPISGSPARRTVQSKPRMRKRKPKCVPEGLAV